MLFFRSEERIEQWCQVRLMPKRPVVKIDQLWGLSTAWYTTRLQPDARRPGPDEMRGIFAKLGLTDDFWDPQMDRFE